jgi:glycosyltransferase involved in cell wall biosynthesis
VHSSSGRYGADRQLLLVASGLDRARYEPIVALPDDGPLVSDLMDAEVEVVTRSLSAIRRQNLNPLGLSRTLAAAARDAAALGSLIRHRQVALVHSNTSVVLGGAAAAAVRRIPHVWQVREIYSSFARLWPPYRRVLATASALPCVSAATAAQFNGRGRARVIHEALAFDARREPKERARVALGLDSQVPVIAVLGRISQWKGQDVLVRALAEPALRERGVIGLIAGEVWPGTEHRLEAVLRLARELGIEERLRLPGFRDDVNSIYGAADLIAVPSTEPDPLPGTAIEAAAAGCAVIAAAHGGLPEIIRDRETGRLVSPGDHRALAAVAAELLDNPAERERLGVAAAGDVRQRFAPARLLAAVQDLYDEVLSDPTQPPRREQAPRSWRRYRLPDRPVPGR